MLSDLALVHCGDLLDLSHFLFISTDSHFFFLPQMIFSAVYVFSPIDIIPEGISVVLHFIKMCYLDNTNMKSTVGLNPQRFWE